MVGFQQLLIAEVAAAAQRKKKLLKHPAPMPRFPAGGLPHRITLSYDTAAFGGRRVDAHTRPTCSYYNTCSKYRLVTSYTRPQLKSLAGNLASRGRRDGSDHKKKIITHF